MEIEATQGLRRFGGFRVTIPAFLGKVRLQVQVDLGFGDTVTPAPKRITYPTALAKAGLIPGLQRVASAIHIP